LSRVNLVAVARETVPDRGSRYALLFELIEAVSLVEISALSKHVVLAEIVSVVEFATKWTLSRCFTADICCDVWSYML
jgi:hypothetical protein